MVSDLSCDMLRNFSPPKNHKGTYMMLVLLFEAPHVTLGGVTVKGALHPPDITADQLMVEFAELGSHLVAAP